METNQFQNTQFLKNISIVHWKPTVLLELNTYYEELVVICNFLSAETFEKNTSIEFLKQFSSKSD